MMKTWHRWAAAAVLVSIGVAHVAQPDWKIDATIATLAVGLVLLLFPLKLKSLKAFGVEIGLDPSPAKVAADVGAKAPKDGTANRKSDEDHFFDGVVAAYTSLKNNIEDLTVTLNSEGKTQTVTIGKEVATKLGALLDYFKKNRPQILEAMRTGADWPTTQPPAP